jgi:hypothetical protein
VKALLALGTVAIVGVLLFVAFDPASVEMREDRAYYARQQQQLDLQRQQLQLDQEKARATVLQPASVAGQLLVSTVLIVALAGLVAIAGHAYVRRSRLVFPDRSGALPVAYRDAINGRLNDVAIELASMRRAVELATAQKAAVPHNYAPHVTYSPEWSYEPRITGTTPPAQLDAAPAPALALPGLTDLATISHTPRLDSILLGLAPGGDLITVGAHKLCHVALCGATGGGKSNLLRLLIPQLQAVGARVLLADPHYTPFDSESGDDWRAITQRLYRPPAVQAAQIDALLDYLVNELDARMKQREQGAKLGPPLFLALDELPVIADSVKDSVERLGRVLREGRKVGVFVVGASQDFLVKTLGGSGGIRDCYRTAFYVGGDLVSAAALLDLPRRDIDDGALDTGLAYLRSEATRPAQLVRIPLASNAAISRLLTDDQPTMGRYSSPSPAASPAASLEGAREGDGEGGCEGASEGADTRPLPRHSTAVNLSSEAAWIVQAFLGGKSPTDLASELAGGATGGKKYQAAAKKVADALRQGLRQGADYAA